MADQLVWVLETAVNGSCPTDLGHTRKGEVHPSPHGILTGLLPLTRVSGHDWLIVYWFVLFYFTHIGMSWLQNLDFCAVCKQPLREIFIVPYLQCHETSGFIISFASFCGLYYKPGVPSTFLNWDPHRTSVKINYDVLFGTCLCIGW